MSLYSAKAQFYKNLINTEKAGVLLSKALRLKQPAPFDIIGNSIASMLENGEGKLNELMKRYPKQFTEFESSLVNIGESSGNLEKVFDSLAKWFETLHKIRSQFIISLIYPAFLYEMIVTLIPLVAYFRGKTALAPAVILIAVMSSIPYLFFFVALPVIKSMSKSGNGFFSGFIFKIPILGKTLKKYNYAVFFNSFGLTLNSGINIKEAIILSAKSCSSQYISNKFISMVKSIENDGKTFSEAFTKNVGGTSVEEYASAYIETAEHTGNIGDMSVKIGNTFLEESEKEIGMISKAVSFLMFLAVAIYIGYEVVSFWSNQTKESFQKFGL